MKPKPVLRWAGGKSDLDLKPYLPDPRRWKRYVEPFAGGAAVFFSTIAFLWPHKDAWLNDINARLVTFYTRLRDDPHGLVEQLEIIASRLAALERADKAREAYEMARDALNTDPRITAPLVYWINKTCFNGLWRENQDGGFNVPVGDKPFIQHMDHNDRLFGYVVFDLYLASAALMRAALTTYDFEAVLEQCGDGDVAYLDPPYLTENGHTTYAAGGFSQDDHARLAAAARAASERGATILASNADTPVVRELWADFTLVEIGAKQSIAADGESRGVRADLLIVRYPPGKEP